MNHDLQKLLKTLGERWSVTVITALRLETLGFAELRRRIPDVSQRMLSATLRNLAALNLVSRVVVSTTPPRVNYSLTAAGGMAILWVTGLNNFATESGVYGAKAEPSAKAVA